jgi:predicted acyltransferase
MNAFRSIITGFLAAMIVVASFGWAWTTTLPAPRQIAARTVLVLAAGTALAGMIVIWRIPRHRES